MSKPSQTLIDQLEGRIAELTRTLEQADDKLQRQAGRVAAGQQICELISSNLDPGTLNRKIVQILKDQFDLYHVSIFLVDQSGQWAVVDEAAGKASRTMKKEGYRLAVDEPSTIGWVCQNQKSYLSSAPDSMAAGNGHEVVDISLHRLPKACSELALPLVSESRLIGVLDLHSLHETAFDQDDLLFFQHVADQIGTGIGKIQQYNEIARDRDRANLLSELTIALNAKLKVNSIATIAVGLAEHLDASSGQINLIADTGEIFFKSSVSERNQLDDIQRKTLVRRTLAEGLDAWVLKTGQPALVTDTETDERWLPIEHPDQTIPVRSAMCSPLVVGQGRLRGAISFVHPQPNHFDEPDLALFSALSAQITVALDNAVQLRDVQNSLDETHLMLDISRQLAGAKNFKEVYAAFVQGVMSTGVERCLLYMSEEFDTNNVPKLGQVVHIGDVDATLRNEKAGQQIALTDYPVLIELALSQEALLIGDIETDERLTADERAFFGRFGTRSMVINPLIARGLVVSMISIEYRTPHHFNERELAMYRALCNQATLAIENARQIERTEMALAETQSLYRAGRVLAGAADLQEILEEALIEFLYSLGLDQGGITLLTPDRANGQLMAYVQNGLLQDVEHLIFPIDDDIAYQQPLLDGQPLVSPDVANDPRLTEYRSFNTEVTTKSLLEAPMIFRGETIGWIGADAVKEHRVFSQREIDLARAMADQIAITIQNRALLEQTKRHADQLKAVASVGKQVSHLIDLNELLNNTVNLIRDRFGFYHVSIFLIDEAREWAIVRASTGEVGKMMVERPHRLRVNGQSIVGYVTGHIEPRVALDVGQDAVHFKNPDLPDTRSEMALPLVARGKVIGALDVQSVEPNAFGPDDVETLQVMADQLAAAIENARLFEETQRHLLEQAVLYNIGTKLGATLNLTEATANLVVEMADALNATRCVLMLIEEETEFAHILNDYTQDDPTADNNNGLRFPLSDSSMLTKILATKQEFIYHVNDLPEKGFPKDINKVELEYLFSNNVATLAIVPIPLRNNIIGFITIYDSNTQRRFTQEDIALLDAIALQAANAIENARLYEATQESQAFMKAIIDEIPDPIFIKDRDHKWVIVNKALCEDILGLPEDKVVGRSDYDYSPKEEADWFWEQDNKVFESGQIQETEEPHTDQTGRERTLYTRKIPLTLTATDGRPDYLLAILNDITERKQRESERERLIEETGRALERTQSLYRISAVLATTSDQETTFETVLGEYLRLLNLKQGRLVLLDKNGNYDHVPASFIDSQTVEVDPIFPIENDRIMPYLLKNPKPLWIENVHTHQLTWDIATLASAQVETMLFIPLVMRGSMAGLISVDSTAETFSISQDDIEIGEVIADQLTIWLENRRLLEESQHRTNLLQTAAEVSKQASSLLDVGQLINTSVNFIRDQFDFYYVGLFLVDAAREWAVLRAGTGEAGRLQLENKHSLEIGGESMIGWCIQNRQARIALDVGKDPVQFKNRFLPDTRSEMALPLISRDDVIGALTVQSVEQTAFSDEDITVLQTMADQLANAIANARLFAQTQIALAETETLYKITQELLSSDNEKTIYQAAMDAIINSGIDSCAIFVHIGEGESERIIEQKASWTRTGQPPFPNGIRVKAADVTIDQFVPRHEPLLIEDIEHDTRLTEQIRQALTSIGIRCLLILSLSTHQDRFGFLLIAYKEENKSFSRQQIRFYTTIGQQMVAALANLRLLEASQRRAQREEIIREITAKIRGSITVDDVLQTTVTELSKVLGASQGGITLNVAAQLALRNIKRANGDGADKQT